MVPLPVTFGDVRVSVVPLTALKLAQATVTDVLPPTGMVTPGRVVAVKAPAVVLTVKLVCVAQVAPTAPNRIRMVLVPFAGTVVGLMSTGTSDPAVAPLAVRLAIWTGAAAPTRSVDRGGARRVVRRDRAAGERQGPGAARRERRQRPGLREATVGGDRPGEGDRPSRGGREGGRHRPRIARRDVDANVVLSASVSAGRRAAPRVVDADAGGNARRHGHARVRVGRGQGERRDRRRGGRIEARKAAASAPPTRRVLSLNADLLRRRRSLNAAATRPSPRLF